MAQTDARPRPVMGSLLQGLVIFGVFTAIACVWIWIRNLELFAARSRIQKGARPWDVPVTIGIISSFAASSVIRDTPSPFR